MRPADELNDLLEEVVGQRCDADLLVRALTHRSYSYEHDNVPHNERLEFLGDSVLGVVVTDHLYRVHPELAEGKLAKLRAAVVNSRALAEVAATIDLGDFVLLGKGEEATGGREKASILADTTEALIGCVYLCSGMRSAHDLVHHLLDPLIERSATLGAALDWKTSLQEAAVGAGLEAPEYRVDAEGPDHDKRFTAYAVVGERVLGTGKGRSKKLAEQEAAEQAWRMLTQGGAGQPVARAAVSPIPAAGVLPTSGDDRPGENA